MHGYRYNQIGGVTELGTNGFKVYVWLHGLQRTVLPLVDVRVDLVVNLGNQRCTGLSTIYFLQMGLNVSGGHSLGIQTDDLPFKPFEATAVLRHDFRHKRTFTVTRQIDSDFACFGRYSFLAEAITAIGRCCFPLDVNGRTNARHMLKAFSTLPCDEWDFTVSYQRPDR